VLLADVSSKGNPRTILSLASFSRTIFILSELLLGLPLPNGSLFCGAASALALGRRRVSVGRRGRELAERGGWRREEGVGEFWESLF
jgi:hypothetical protein